MITRRLLPLIAAGLFATTLTACSADEGSAVGTTSGDDRPVYAFPSDEAIREAARLTQEREGGLSDWGDIYEQRKTWNGQADFTCTRLIDGHSLEEIAGDSFGPLVNDEDRRARLDLVISNACPELAP